MNDVRSEDLLSFVRQKEHEVVHGVYTFMVISVLGAEPGQKLFANQLYRTG